MSLAGTGDTGDTALVNMARLLQTLDTDGDVDNGITIGEDAHTNGWVATLSTLGHNVSGQATIVNDCTIRIDNFNYDGTGLPDVLVYAGLNGDYGGGFAISDNLFGVIHTDETLFLTLPQSRTLDNLNGVSVWCVVAQADFGSGMFMPP